jgi:hypothetical protein
MTAAIAPPPGQLDLFPPRPAQRRPRWLRVVDPTGGQSETIRDLPIAAGRAHATAVDTGESWLVADDRSSCHVTAAGDVAPTSGWPLLVARIITIRKENPSP